MTWKIKFHNLVLKEDFKNIDKNTRTTVVRSIESKLSKAPDKFGRQLSGELNKYRRLKVGDYRVIYETLKSKVMVHVVKIGIRRDFQVYNDLIKRLNKLP
jgi:mRNA interferase RelE/StbE